MPTRLLGRLADHPVLRRRTLRLRITVLYGVPFLLSGAALLALTNLLARSGSTTAVQPVRAGAGAAAALAQLPDGAVNQRAADLHQLLVGSTIALAIMTLVSLVLGWVVAGR